MAERARSRHSSSGIQFIQVDLLGTVPCNRSGLGVSGFHVHEVVASIRDQGLSRRRYRDCTVVRVPASKLEEFRKFNEEMCQGDDLLPAFSPNMKYALLTNNHFVCALKLFQSASALMNGTHEVIKPNRADVQLMTHLSEGVACEVMAEELWLEDKEGMEAIVGEDNLDAATDLPASEIEVLSTLRRLIDDTKGNTDPHGRFRLVINRAKARFGTQSFSEADMANLFNYAIRVPSPLVTNLCQVHFATVPAALLRVRPCDFGQLAKIEMAHPYVKVSLVISMYLGAIASGGGALRRQSGGVAAFAVSIKKDSLDKIVANRDMRDAVESFIKAVLKHYRVQASAVLVKELLLCRARLFHRIGRVVLDWPASDFAIKGALAKTEAKYAAELLAANAFEHPPSILYVAPKTRLTAGTEQAQQKQDGKKKRTGPESLEIYAEEEPSASALDGPPASALAGPPAAKRVRQSCKTSQPASSAASAPAPLGPCNAYSIPQAEFHSMEPCSWAPLPKLLWQRLAQQGLLQLHMKQKLSADGVSVQVLEAAEPVVYQASALKTFGAGELMLVPFMAGELVAFEDGSKLKRPKTLHPHLPFLVACQAGVVDADDYGRFLVKSPLASASIPKVAPSPFWGVLESQSPEDTNMKVSTFRMVLQTPDFMMDGKAMKARGKQAVKPKAVYVDVPALVNIIQVERGTVLTFSGAFGLADVDQDE